MVIAYLTNKNNMMRKINKNAILLFIVIIAMVSCENASIEFDDFGKTVCYFPYQTPARTLILGKYDQGFNDNDNKHQFEIGVTMTGVYENKSDRKVYFKLDQTLLSNVTNVLPLPANYYSIETASPVIIPKGDIKGRIMIKLTDAFFNDSKAMAALNTVNYAIPLVITSVEGLDSIFSGTPAVVNPNRNKKADWVVTPKDYTLFGIKYINKFHGNYLRRGADKLLNASNVEVGTTIYHNQYVERDEIVKATSFDLTSVTLPNTIRRFGSTNGGTINLKLVFAADGTCSVFNTLDNKTIGTGSFKENGDKWGGISQDVIYLDYAYTDLVLNEKHQVKDTLVIRDRGVVFETFSATIQ
jgi:hypothetical protein